MMGALSTCPPHLKLFSTLPKFPVDSKCLPSSDTSFECKIHEVRDFCVCIWQWSTGSMHAMQIAEWMDGWTAYPLEQMWCVLECFLVDLTNFQTNPTISRLTHYKIKPFGRIHIFFCLTLYVTWPLMFLWARASSWPALLCWQNANTTTPACLVLFPPEHPGREIMYYLPHGSL